MYGDQRFRALTVVDAFSRESLALEPGAYLRGEDLARVLNRIAARQGAPKHIYCDNGSEFCSRLVDLWAYYHKADMAFSRPGMPTDHAHIESFNRALRDDCPNFHWIQTIEKAKEHVEAWWQEYNDTQPHRALKNLAARQHLALWAEQRTETS